MAKISAAWPLYWLVTQTKYSDYIRSQSMYWHRDMNMNPFDCRMYHHIMIINNVIQHNLNQPTHLPTAQSTECNNVNQHDHYTVIIIIEYPMVCTMSLPIDGQYNIVSNQYDHYTVIIIIGYPTVSPSHPSTILPAIVHWYDPRYVESSRVAIVFRI